MTKSTYLEVIPAYGRDYNNKKDAIKDWKDGKDFIDSVTRSYVGKEYADREGLTVLIRYNRLTRVTGLR